MSFIVDNYVFISGIVIIFLLILNLYNSIRFECLKKAAEKVASVEKYKELSGEEKFLIVVTWITDDLPSVFKNAFIISLIKKLVQFAYDTSISFMKNYIKRKTGYDISEILQDGYERKSDDSNDTL